MIESRPVDPSVAERRLAMLLESSPAGMCFVGADGRFLEVNSRLCAIFGSTRDELLASTFGARTSLAGSETIAIGTRERYVVAADGRAVACEVTFSRVDDAGADEAQFLGIVKERYGRDAGSQTVSNESLNRIAGEAAHLGGWALDFADATEFADAKLSWSDEVCAIHDVPAGEVPNVCDGISYYVPESRERTTAALETCLHDGTPFDLELQIVTALGRPRWVRSIGRRESGTRRLVGAYQDITERKEAELELVRMNRALTMLSGCNEALVRATDERRLLQDLCELIVASGGYVTAWVGYPSDNVVGTIVPVALAGRGADDELAKVPVSWSADRPEGRGISGETMRNGVANVVVDIATDPRFVTWRERALARGFRSGVCLPLRDGPKTIGILTLYSTEVASPPNSELVLLQQLADDLAFGVLTITQRKAAEREIENLAFYDPLTRLPNRLLLQQNLDAAIATCADFGAVLFIDLDNFKALNDTLGHDKGDIFLRQVARRLQDCVRPQDTVARFGGDEFVIVVRSVGTTIDEAEARANAIASDVLAAFDLPFALDTYELISTPSIGVTMFDRADTTDGLLKEADLAMYEAKATGRNTVRFFDPRMQTLATARRALEDDIRLALKNDDFTLVFQPQVDVAGGVIGAEALVRWRHPERGAIAPMEFISAAEESGLIVPLGRSIVRMACSQLMVWSAHPATATLDLSVNVSAREFRHPDFVRTVGEALAASGADPRRLVLELTESVLVDDVDVVIAKMTALRELGVTFSLDDFGTGYSSLAYLKRLPLRQLKIDQSFVRDVLVDTNDAVIARTIVALGGSLSIDVIAEGVETEAQLAFLVAHGCRSFQGYHFSRPLPQAEYLEYVLAHSPRAASTLAPGGIRNQR